MCCDKPPIWNSKLAGHLTRGKSVLKIPDDTRRNAQAIKPTIVRPITVLIVGEVPTNETAVARGTNQQPPMR